MTIYEIIKGLREDNDLSQSKIANYLNISQSTYSRYENGSCNIPLETIIKLSQYYKISADYILGLSYTYDRPKR